MKDFYQTVLDIQPDVESTFGDTHMAVFGGTGNTVDEDVFSPDAALYLVQRPALLASNDKDKFRSTKWFGSYLKGVNEHYMTGYKSCW